MKLPWILFVSSLCAEAYGSNIQTVLGNSLDLSGTLYTCENGMLNFTVFLNYRFLLNQLGVKPSITCEDLSHIHSCSCTCTNGLRFEQSLPSSVQPDGSSSSSSSLDACQKANNECLVREQDLTNQLSQKERDLLQREEELSAALSNCKGNESPLNFTTPHQIESKICTTAILQPWVHMDMNRPANTLNPSNIATRAVNNAEDSILVVSDSVNRCEQFEVYVDGILIGETSGKGLLDGKVCGGPDECMKNGGHHGYFTLPKGKIDD
jgi:hypothetical protein